MIKDDEKLKITKIFKVNEAAIYLGVSELFIYKIIKSEKLVAKKIGLIYLITETALKKYKEISILKVLVVIILFTDLLRDLS